ncbi:TetR/AcrR family transcriptional regulator [Streptomyces sp. MST-110588]|uniref:TetR/AcrR family transcriptional regulator n=1 Tax=Streptomyces sp. MST-110588 TaxID=2833628 RepID=UPI001F5E2D16|nr:TetR/AcrR family transcriptional regulator [Streptomyces sp. MST-110588]UNO40164.1 TetR/AcrR family transcriptional regulator [Streptomyces sp. MST-110588]
MARPRNFDEERALDAALEAFWAAGYEATSTQDLCAATGLGRSSVYNTFKSKHALFERALDRYMERKNAELFALLAEELPVRRKIRAVLQLVIDEDFGEGADGRGCLVVRTAAEVASRDEAVAAMLARDYRERLTAVRAAIETAQRDGEIGADKDPLVLAHLVLTTVAGLRVSARNGAGKAALESVADASLAAF